MDNDDSQTFNLWWLDIRKEIVVKRPSFRRVCMKEIHRLRKESMRGSMGIRRRLRPVLTGSSAG